MGLFQFIGLGALRQGHVGLGRHDLGDDLELGQSVLELGLRWRRLCVAGPQAGREGGGTRIQARRGAASLQTLGRALRREHEHAGGQAGCEVARANQG